MKKIIALLLALVMVMGLVACGNNDAPAASTPATPNDSAASSTPADKPNAPAEDREKIELIFQIHDAATATSSMYYQSWADKIYEASDGLIEIIIYAGGVLGSQKDTYNMILTGACDLGWCSQNSQQGAFPMTEFFTLPRVGFSSTIQASKMLWDLYEKTDYLDKEYENFKVLAVHSYCDVPLGFSDPDTVIESVADLKNVGIRTSGKWMTAFFTELGANPTTINAGEIYTSLEKGVVQACAGDWNLVKSYNLAEQYKVTYDLKLTYGCGYVCMNLDKWNSLPAWAQEIIDEYSGQVLSEGAGAAWTESRDYVIDQINTLGYELREPNADLVADLDEVSAALHQQWIDENGANGLPAQEVYDWVMENMEAYK